MLRQKPLEEVLKAAKKREIGSQVPSPALLRRNRKGAGSTISPKGRSESEARHPKLALTSFTSADMVKT